jgi:rhamnose transport system permease protein
MTRRMNRRDLALAAVIVGISLTVGLRSPVFLTPRNALDIANDSALLAILVIGQMPVLLTRGIDLSVASNLALTGMLVALFGKFFPGAGAPVLIVLALALGAAQGALNGWLITRFDLPPIVVTLGTLSVYRGAIFLVSGGAWVNDQDIHASIKALPRSELLGLPLLVWFAAVVAGLGGWLLRWRREGRDLYAIGGNPAAARVVGIPVARRIRMAYMLSGALAGLAGLLWVGRYAIAFTELAAGFELTVIAACVIGGISIAGGVGTVGGALLGVLFIGIINAALPVIHVSPFWQQAIAGAVILVSVILNSQAQRQPGQPILQRSSS